MRLKLNFQGRNVCAPLGNAPSNNSLKCQKTILQKNHPSHKNVKLKKNKIIY